MKQALNDALKQHLDSQSLDMGQLNQLRALQPAAQNARPKNKWRCYQVGAGLLATFALFALLINFLLGQTSQHDMIEQIANEVVTNHLHLKPLEIESNQIAGLQGYFTLLDFQPINSRNIDKQQMQLLGGRYCSLQGITAAQLRFQSTPDNRIRTLYQVAYDPAVFSKLPDIDKNQQPVSTYAKGIKVSIWVEKDVLFALTEE